MVFKVFSCDDQAVEGESYLRDDYGISCNTDKHFYFSMYAGIMIVVRTGQAPENRPLEAPTRNNTSYAVVVTTEDATVNRCYPQPFNGKLLFPLLFPEETRRRRVVARSDTVQLNLLNATRRGACLVPAPDRTTHKCEPNCGFLAEYQLPLGACPRLTVLLYTIPFSAHSEAGARLR